MKHSVSRRQFVAGVGMTAAGSVMAGAATSAFADEPAPTTSADYLAKWSFEIAPDPISDEEITETFETDVVVVGAGTAGLVAANSAMDEGLSVALVSASSIPIYRGGSNHAVMSKTKERLGIPKADERLFERELINNGLRVDQRKWYGFYNNSEEAMNWLIDIMEEKGYETSIETPPEFFDDDNYFTFIGAHGWMTPETHTTGMNQEFVVNELASRLADGGYPVAYNTIGRQLVRGGVANGTEGRVDAVICERADGTFAKYVGTKAVVLATGDFSADRDMMYKYAPDCASIVADEIFDGEVDYDRCFAYGGLYKGDGHKMGLWVGAAWQKIWPCCPMGGAFNSGPTNKTTCFSGLKVNRNGERFMNEYGMRDMTGLAARNQPGRENYSLWNANYATKFPFTWITGNVPYGEDAAISPEAVIESWDEGVELGNYVKGDTIEEVIAQLGLPESTIETVNRYNELCEKGVDDDFHKRPELLIALDEGPFYGQKGTSTVFLCILGGLRTDANMHVCNENDEPIPGLYNVGTMVGDMYDVNYTFQIPGMNLGSTCVTFPYMLGKYIAANE